MPSENGGAGKKGEATYFKGKMRREEKAAYLEGEARRGEGEAAYLEGEARRGEVEGEAEACRGGGSEDREERLQLKLINCQ